MGLDIIAYQIRCRREAPTASTIYLHNIECYQDRGIEDGHYDVDTVYDFRAGSYSGYNDWRNLLSLVMLGVNAENVWNNDEYYKDKPFYYLINFSDCEGYIAGDCLIKLREDFTNTYKIDQYPFDDNDKEWFVEIYNHFIAALEYADVIVFC